MQSTIDLIKNCTDGAPEVCDHDLAHLIEAELSSKAAQIALEDEERISMVVALLKMRLTPATEGGPYSPIFQIGDQRSLLPSDLDQSQHECAIEIARSVNNQMVKARLLDSAFAAGHWSVGRETVTAYNHQIRRLINCEYAREVDEIDASATDIMPLLIRMNQIDRRITKGSGVSLRSRTTTRAVCNLAFQKRDFFRFSEALEIAVLDRVHSRSEAAELAFELASLAGPEESPMAVKCCFEAAAYWIGDENHVQRDKAILEAAKCSIKMADQNPQAIAAANWIKTAINEIRRVPGNDQWIAELKVRLRELQEKASQQVGSISTQLKGLKGFSRRSRNYFSKVSLSNGLREVAMQIWPKEIASTKRTIDDISKNTIFDKLISTSYLDQKGRTTSHGLDPTQFYGTEEYYKERAARDLGIERRFQIVGLIEPARQALFERFSITEHHIYPIILNSAFVPRERSPIFATGLAHLWQGNYLVASHLLVPQIENSLRVLLELAGHDQSILSSTGTEGDRSLSSLLNNFRPELNTILTEHVVWELDVLFNFRPGPAFRHALSHGNLPYGAFYGDIGKASAWFCYFLVTVFALPNWERQVRPMYDRAGLG